MPLEINENSTIIKLFTNYLKGDREKCWLWKNGFGKDGYGRFKVKGKTYGAHRLAYMLIFGEIPEGALVMHICDNPACVNPHHLKLGTHKDNAQDCKNKGRLGNRGVKHKLSLEDRQAIKRKKATMTVKELSIYYGVTTTTIRNYQK